MRLITIAAACSLLFALESALADEGKASAGQASDGMKLAEEVLLQEDLEVVPAKEEKVEQKKRATEETETGEAPLLGTAPASPAEVLASLQDAPEASSEPKVAGSLGYEMDTVEMLADAPALPAVEQEKTDAEAAVAKR